MGLIELMESDSRWKMLVGYDAEDAQWVAVLRKYEMVGPSYRATDDNMLGAITELDWNIRQNNKAQEA